MIYENLIVSVLGSWNIDVAELQVELSLDWVLANFIAIGKPLFAGR